MSPPGRPKGESLSAQHEGTPGSGPAGNGPPEADRGWAERLERVMSRLIQRLVRLESGVAITAMAAIVIALSADLAGREFFGKGIFVAQRFAVYCMIVCAMLGFALAVSWGAHMRIGGLERLFPKPWKARIDRLADLVSCGACLFLAGWSAKFVAVSYQQQAVGQALEIVLWPIQAVFIWCFVSSALRYAAYAVYPSSRPADEAELPLPAASALRTPLSETGSGDAR
jgi:C4-dicarboxylate transporter, DctQ subunit